MKKIISLMLSIMMLLTLSSCETDSLQKQNDSINRLLSVPELMPITPEFESYSISFIQYHKSDYSYYMIEGCKQAIEELNQQNIFVNFSVEYDDFAVYDSLIINRISSITDKKDAIILQYGYEEEYYRRAQENDVKLVVLDSYILENYQSSFESDVFADAVYLNNSYENGKLAAELMLKELENREINSGKIVLMGGTIHRDYVDYREVGFLSVAQDSGYELIDIRTDDPDDIMESLEDFLNKRSNTDIVGFITFNNYYTDVFTNTIEDAGLAESTVTVCFDELIDINNVSLIDYRVPFENLSIDYDLNVNPYKMGYQGLMGAVEMLRGEPIESKINYIPPIVISADNYPIIIDADTFFDDFQ